MITIKIKCSCLPKKELFRDFETHYRIISCVPLDYYPELELNKHGNFSISGSNLDNIQLNQEANLVLTEDNKSKYPASYVMVSYEGVELDEKGEILVDQRYELEILNRLMEASQAKNVNEAYPNFVSLVLNNKQDTIDFKNIKNVGQKRLDLYISKVQSDCKSILFFPAAFENGIASVDDIKSLRTFFKMPDIFLEKIRENPYFVYMNILGYSFEKADKLVLKYYPDFIDSKLRCEYGCLEILKQSELDGDTRINGSLMASEAIKLMPEAKHHMAEVIKNSDLIHFDENSKYTAIEQTYQNELLITENIIDRLKNPRYTPMNWKQYATVDGFELTDEQQKILREVQNNSIIILTGSAGCVDCDTEFFNGEGWKRIADYEQGDKVLQYNQDGSAELVNPERFIKVPCENLWHFETRHGVSQTVCEYHRIIYKTRNNVLKECNIDELKKMHLPKNKNFQGRFITTFNYNKKGIDLTENEIRLICAVMADSHLQNKNTGYCVFHLKKERKINRLIDLFKKNKINYKLNINKETGYYNFYANIPNAEKHFSKKWYNCSKEQMKIILDEICYWDGSFRKTKNGVEYKTYYTSIKSDADFIQFIASCCGIKAQIRIQDNIGEIHVIKNKKYVRKTLCYIVSFSNRNTPGLCSDNRKNFTKTPISEYKTIDGYKYCFTVPSGMIVLRNNNKICVTGNCGKTSSVKALIRMLEGNNYTYTLLSPTGIAAQRLRETTGREASTIHSFLLKGNRNNDFVIVDEASMCSASLVANLFKLIPKTTKIIFICDTAQLPSISAVNVVHDILDSKLVCNVNLTKIFRYNSSGLITVATDTRNQNPASFKNNYPDYHFIEAEKDSVSQVVNIYGEALLKGYSKNDILVLTPYNKSSKGTYAINEAIQEKYNSNEFTNVSIKKGTATIRFKIGDRVINKKNNYHIPTLEYDEETGKLTETAEEIFVANGSIGVIREYYNEDGYDCLAIEFEEGIGLFKGKDISNLLLGYAVTIHASQGNQAKAVIVLFDTIHKRMMNCNIQYVAFTRSKDELWVIGDSQTITETMSIEETTLRDTWLGDMLKVGWENNVNELEENICNIAL